MFERFSGSSPSINVAKQAQLNTLSQFLDESIDDSKN